MPLKFGNSGHHKMIYKLDALLTDPGGFKVLAQIYGFEITFVLRGGLNVSTFDSGA